jgi:phosphohistidine phosphatase
MQLFLVRHGLAGSGDDPSLTPKGQKRVQRVAEFLGKAGVRSERLIHSHLKRAIETAEILAPIVAPGVELEEVDGLQPESPPRIALALIEQMKTDAMLVGHMPHLGFLAAHLLTGRDDGAIIEFRRAGAICLEREDAEYVWALNWSIRPGLLK